MVEDGSFKEIDADFIALYTSVYEDFGGNGERVLGFAMRPMLLTLDEELEKNSNYKEELKEGLIGKGDKITPINDLVFVGLITLMDPPRPEVPQAIAECHAASIKVVMVTGDHPLTAAAIARKIGLLTLPTRNDIAKQRGILPAEVPEEDIQAIMDDQIEDFIKNNFKGEIDD